MTKYNWHRIIAKQKEVINQPNISTIEMITIFLFLIIRFCHTIIPPPPPLSKKDGFLATEPRIKDERAYKIA